MNNAPTSQPRATLLPAVRVATALLVGSCLAGGASLGAAEGQRHFPAFELAAEQQAGGEKAAEAVLRAATPVQRTAIQAELLAQLRRRDLPEAGRRWVLRVLPPFSDHEAMPVLLKLCRDPRWTEAAAETMVRVPGEAADVEVLRALSDEFHPARLALVGVAERRLLQGAVPVLTTLARGHDAALVNASLRALGTIGSEGAFQSLRALRLSPEFNELRVRSLVAALARLAGSRTADPAVRRAAAVECRGILTGSWPLTLRASALNSLVLFDGVASSSEVLRALRGSEPELRRAAIAALASARFGDLTAVVLSSWADLPRDARAELLDTLGREGDSAVRDTAFAALGGGDAGMRGLAAAALGRLADAGDTLKLLALVEAQGEAAPEAAALLARIKDPAVDVLLRERLGRAGPVTAACLLEICATRGDRAVWDPACVTVSSGTSADPALRASALEAVRLLAQPGDLPRLLALLDAAQAVSEVRILEAALRSVAPASPDAAAVAGLALSRLSASSGDPARTRALLVCLAGLDTPAAAAHLRGRLAEGPSEAWRDLVRMLGLSRQKACAPLLREALRATPAGPDQDLVRASLALLEVAQPSR